MNIIYKQNFDEYIKKYFSHYTKAVIRGKGPTYKELDAFDDNTLYISVNDVVNVTKHTDLMVANDIEMFDRTDISKISKLKHLLIPNRVHKDNHANNNISYEDVIKKITGIFTGNLIVYNLKSTKEKNEKFIDLNSVCSSSNNAADLIGQYMHNIQSVTFYGVGILENGSGYANVFPKTKAINDYVSSRLKGIKNTAIESLKNKEVEFL